MNINQTITAQLRDAPWATPYRLRAYALISLAITAVVLLAGIIFSRHGLDPTGRPIGSDFASFWTASRLALSGEPAAVYDMARHYAEQKALFGGDVQYAAFFYPPVFLLICLPLAALPYPAALTLWLGATLASAGAGLRAYAGVRRLPLIAFLAFPAVLITIGHGQNAFLVTALFAFGLALLDKRPIASGLLLGLLIFKPHLGLMLPVALAFSNRWKTFVAAGVSALLAIGVSWLAFGTVVWEGFISSSAMARKALEDGLVGHEKMQSVFAGVRLLHGDIMLAYGAQTIMIAFGCAAIIWAARQKPSPAAYGALIVTITLLASPFLLDYDLMLLAIPLFFLWREGQAHGFAPWEKSLLIAAYILPGASRLIAGHLGLPLAPIVLLALLALLLRRIGGASGRSATASPSAVNYRTAICPETIATSKAQ